jgi:Na+-driven multidrug efflux pump
VLRSTYSVAIRSSACADSYCFDCGPPQCVLQLALWCALFLSLLDVSLNSPSVWGPDGVRLGYIGAPLATGLSFNLIALCTLIYAVAFAPRVAWHPIGRASFKNLGILVQLGLASVGA